VHFGSPNTYPLAVVVLFNTGINSGLKVEKEKARGASSRLPERTIVESAPSWWPNLVEATICVALRGVELSSFLLSSFAFLSFFLSRHEFPLEKPAR